MVGRAWARGHPEGRVIGFGVLALSVCYLNDTAVDLGVPADAPGLDPNFSTVLGSATVSPIDMANAFGSIAAGGRAKEEYVVEAVESADGAVQLMRARPCASGLPNRTSTRSSPSVSI